MKSSSNNKTKIATLYLIGTLFNRGISFLTVPVFTRILTTNDYGIVATYTSWVSIVSMIIGFALHTGIRAAFIDYPQKIDNVMSTVITFTLIIFGGVAVIFTGGVWLLQLNISIALIFMCIVQSFCSAVITDYSMYLMMQYKYRFRTALLILPNLVTVGLSIVAIMWVLRTDLYLGRIVPNAIVYLIFGIILLIVIYKKRKPSLNREYLRFTLKISAPLIVHGIALTVLAQADRTMITALADSSQTGIYSVVYNFSMIVVVITTAIEGIWIPWFTKKMIEKNTDDINKVARDYIHFVTYLICGLVLIAPEILKLLSPEAYWEGISVIPPILITNYVIFLYTMYVNVEHFYKKTVIISFNTGIAAVSNIALNFILIPKYGYIAAAYTTLASYAISLVLHVHYSKKLEKRVIPIKMNIEPMIHIIAVCALFYIIEDSGLARWIIAFVYGGLMLVRERKHIAEYLWKKGKDNVLS